MREASQAQPDGHLPPPVAGPAEGSGERDIETLEERLAGIWREVLDRPDIGLDDNLFDQGAQSILLIRAHHRLVRELGRDVAVVTLFRYPTVRSLARFLSAGEQDDASGDLLAERRKAGRQRLDTRRSARRNLGA